MQRRNSALSRSFDENQRTDATREVVSSSRNIQMLTFLIASEYNSKYIVGNCHIKFRENIYIAYFHLNRLYVNYYYACQDIHEPLKKT